MIERLSREPKTRHALLTAFVAGALMVGTASAGGDHNHDHGHSHSHEPETEAFFPEDDDAVAGAKGKQSAIDCAPKKPGVTPTKKQSESADTGKQAAEANCKPKQQGNRGDHHVHGGDGHHDEDGEHSHDAHVHQH